MLNIYQEIGDLQSKSSDAAARTLKETHKYKVEEALKFFKEETLRLSKIYKENEAEIERLRKIADTKEFDKKFIEMQIEKKDKRIKELKESVERTTLLFRKLGKDVKLGEKLPLKHRMKITPADYKKGIEDFMIKLMESDASDEEIINEVAKYMEIYSTEVERQIKLLRAELEYEKSKQQQARKGYLDQITNRSELETFFFECLGEMRKEILHKGPKGLVQDPALGDMNGKLEPNKYQALQAVLSNDRILIALFDEIFGPPVKRQEETMFPKLNQKMDAKVKPKTDLISPGNITSSNYSIDYQDFRNYIDYFPEMGNEYK